MRVALEAQVVEVLERALGALGREVNDCWDSACVTAGACSFTNVVSTFYWSASSLVGGLGIVWGGDLDSAVDVALKTDGHLVWPVRGGQ